MDLACSNENVFIPIKSQSLFSVMFTLKKGNTNKQLSNTYLLRVYLAFELVMDKGGVYFGSK